MLTIIMMAYAIITMPHVNLLTIMEMVFVTTALLTLAEKAPDMLTQTVMVSVTTIPSVHHKTVPVADGDVLADKADVADKNEVALCGKNRT